MTSNQKRTRSIWTQGQAVWIIDQTCLPHKKVVTELKTVDDVIAAILPMKVRGAPLIGVSGAYGVCLALRSRLRETFDSKAFLDDCQRLQDARPTAVNLAWAVQRMLNSLKGMAPCAKMLDRAYEEADAIAQREVEHCRQIGQHGLPLVESIAAQKTDGPVNILTHCNAGWLACVEYGTATAPIYSAHAKGLDVHVWVDETRPLNQGARLTAWELGQAGIGHTVITDNAGGHLMQHGQVDMVIVGTDRTTRTGDVANKIGTYLKALAARDNNVPFYVALPSSTFDWQVGDGITGIPIELRDPGEVTRVTGRDEKNRVCSVQITPDHTAAANYAFDVTPARLVTGFITERGVCAANERAIMDLFPEKRDRTD